MVKLKPINNNGSIRIQFKRDGILYNLATRGKFGKRIDDAKAELICAWIEEDLVNGQFDPTLDKYRYGTFQLIEKKPGRDIPYLLDVWDDWVNSLTLSPQTRSDHYQCIRNWLERIKPSPTIECVDWFTSASETLAPSTRNTRLGFLKRCLDWAIMTGKTEDNPYKLIGSVKGIRKKTRPLTLDQIKSIIEGFEGTYYQSFVCFLFLTGCRHSEAIGLQWKRIDFEFREITIADTLARVRHQKERIRKGTKTDSTTVLSMNDDLYTLLVGLERGDPEDLVFRDRKGRAISQNAFYHKWRAVLEKAGIPHIKPYATRHSFASHSLEQGKSILDVAYLLGHRDTTMVSRVYGSIVSIPKPVNLGLLSK